MYVASGIDRHPDRTEIDFRLQIPSLVPLLFREVFSHPYISFFHLLVNRFFCYLFPYIFYLTVTELSISIVILDVHR